MMRFTSREYRAVLPSARFQTWNSSCQVHCTYWVEVFCSRWLGLRYIQAYFTKFRLPMFGPTRCCALKLAKMIFLQLEASYIASHSQSITFNFSSDERVWNSNHLINSLLRRAIANSPLRGHFASVGDRDFTMPNWECLQSNQRRLPRAALYARNFVINTNASWCESNWEDIIAVCLRLVTQNVECLKIQVYACIPYYDPFNIFSSLQIIPQDISPQAARI